MKIADILQALPSKEDVASAIGLETRSSPSLEVLSAFGIFGVGMALGAGLALLLAPKAAREIRHDIEEKIGARGVCRGCWTRARRGSACTPTRVGMAAWRPPSTTRS